MRADSFAAHFLLVREGWWGPQFFPFFSAFSLGLMRLASLGTCRVYVLLGPIASAAYIHTCIHTKREGAGQESLLSFLSELLSHSSVYIFALTSQNLTLSLQFGHLTNASLVMMFNLKFISIHCDTYEFKVIYGLVMKILQKL